ncbi:hypothetical protein PoMZ_00561 [Pyricularia oryzae]|uniref:Uncharacterized protein n=1 Tax=Pyricularia oryzae TaxID=318829 RepID=A0A4P7N0C1_PYROR|nr:hypothetical protein PoMZ_00561 [Pyricularia oryzae]
MEDVPYLRKPLPVSRLRLCTKKGPWIHHGNGGWPNTCYSGGRPGTRGRKCVPWTSRRPYTGEFLIGPWWYLFAKGSCPRGKCDVLTRCTVQIHLIRTAIRAKSEVSS